MTNWVGLCDAPGHSSIPSGSVRARLSIGFSTEGSGVSLLGRGLYLVAYVAWVGGWAVGVRESFLGHRQISISGQSMAVGLVERRVRCVCLKAGRGFFV